jgi:hypothetical protein
MKPILLAVVLATATVPVALAQSPAQIGSQAVTSPKPRGPDKVEPPPPALPGARAEQPAVAPASRTAADMPPTEALFDAINRGDLPMVKDAVSRGAELNGTNVLGLTPIELAVDLGRNQISFYLLSMRGGDTSAGSRPPQTAAAAAPKPPTRAERAAAAQAARTAKAERGRSAVADATPAAPRNATLFSGDGGAPVPQAGFLGFNAIR